MQTHRKQKTLLYNSENIVLADNDIFLTVQLHLCAGILGINDLLSLADLHLSLIHI